jgi:tetratricopeptide (TPR) repeat protein
MIKPMKSASTALVAAVLLALAGQAYAQQPKHDKGDVEPNEVEPWSKGVSQADQEAAIVLFKEGNELLKDSVFVEAVKKYRAALKHWDHPAIHYNMAFALLNLDQPVEVYEHLEKAMEYGPEPLEQEKFELAKSYKALVEKQLSRVEISCDEADAMVTMDGTPLFKAPGRYASLVRAGPHTVLATKEGFQTAEVSQSLPAGQVTKIDLVLVVSGKVKFVRHWAAWKPWVVFGTGALIMAAGGYFQVTAQKAFDDFDAAIEECHGCVPMGEVADFRSSGELNRTLSIVSYSVGGAALVTGAVLLYVNRQRAITPGGKDDDGGGIEEKMSLVPVVGPSSAGFAATVRF